MRHGTTVCLTALLLALAACDKGATFRPMPRAADVPASEPEEERVAVALVESMAVVPTEDVPAVAEPEVTEPEPEAEDAPPPAPPAHRIFVTSAAWTGELTAAYDGRTFQTGLQGADYRCQHLAAKASLPGAWRALLSDESEDAKSRVALEGPIHNMAGDVLATGAAALWDGGLSAPVAYDETGAPQSGGVWTGSSAAGLDAQWFCAGWSESAYAYAYGGFATATSSAWMKNGEATLRCGSRNRLYCVSQPTRGLVAFAAATGTAEAGGVLLALDFPKQTTGYAKVVIRRAAGVAKPAATCDDASGKAVATLTRFTDQTLTDQTGAPGSRFSYRACVFGEGGKLLSSAASQSVRAKGGKKRHEIFATDWFFDGNLKGPFDGRTFPDAAFGARYRCQYFATKQGLGGTWDAVLSIPGNPAASRLKVHAPVHDLLGRRIAPDARAFWSGARERPIEITELGRVVTPYAVWTGSTSAGGLASHHCAGFSTKTGATDGQVGSPASAALALDHSDHDCDLFNALYCISQ